MIVLLDTSVIVAAFTPDIHSTTAERWLETPETYLVSDWASAEFSAAIRNKVRQGFVQSGKVDLVEAAFDRWSAGLGGPIRVLAQDHVRARQLVARHALLRAPDALHVAIAMRAADRLATFDERQGDAALAEGVSRFAP